MGCIHTHFGLHLNGLQTPYGIVAGSPYYVAGIHPSNCQLLVIRGKSKQATICYKQCQTHRKTKARKGEGQFRVEMKSDERAMGLAIIQW